MENQLYRGLLSGFQDARASHRTCMLTLFFLWVVGVAMASSTAQAAAINAVDIDAQPNKTNVVFSLSRSVKYTLFTLDNPDRVVIDFHNVDSSAGLKLHNVERTPIQRIRTGRRGLTTQRVVLDLKEPVLTEHYALAVEKGGYRLGLDLKPLKLAFKTVDALQQTQRDSKIGQNREGNNKKRHDEKRPQPDVATHALRNVVIAIDAGHGGEDPGAVGPNGTLEKDVVLAIAKKLAKAIGTRSGYEAVLVREGDYYIPLAKRREIARKKHNADLFLSIHADSWKRRSAKGASVYALSRKGASSALARHLAAHEKASARRVEKGTKHLSSVLADLAMEGSMEHSMRVGDYVLEELGGVTKLHKKKVEQAAFAVLKSTDVPSLLIETGFISNPQEERQLKNSRHQHKLVKAITEGVQRYFEQQPPPNTWLAAWKARPPATHQIARGETISGIAERYRVSQKRLKKANNLRSDLIRIGQVLHIPSS